MLTDDEALKVAQVTDALTGQHKKWIEEFAKKNYSSYDRIMAQAKAYLDEGVMVTGEIDWDETFWDHYEAIAGAKSGHPWDNWFQCCEGGG